MRIGWIGYHYEGLAAFKNVLRLGYRINVFITLCEDRLVKKSGFTKMYLQYCEKYSIPVIEVNNINDSSSAEILRRLDLDIVFVIGWGQIISGEILKIPKLGMVGAHASLLPKNKGSAPINWSIIKGETKTGNTLILLNPGVDEGSIIDQIAFEITPFDSCKTLYDKVAETNKRMIQRLLRKLDEGLEIRSEEQTSSGDVLSRRRPSDGLIAWNNDSYAIYNFIRALTIPYPGAFSYIKSEKWIIWNASWLPLKFNRNHKPGEIIGPVYNTEKKACGKMVACMDGYLIIHKIQNKEGKYYSGYKLANHQFESNFFENE